MEKGGPASGTPEWPTCDLEQIAARKTDGIVGKKCGRAPTSHPEGAAGRFAISLLKALPRL